MGTIFFAYKRHEVLVTTFFLGALSFVLYLLPFFLHGPHPLGYDTGFYRRYLIQPFSGFLSTPVPGLGSDALLPRGVLDALHALRVPTDLALYGSYLLFFVLLPVLLYLWLKPHLGNQGAMIAGLLLVFSPVHYTAYWYMLYKNALALDLLLLAFICFERHWLWGMLALDVAIGFTHKTTTILYALTLLTLLLLQYRRWRELVGHLAVLGLCFLAVNSHVPHLVATGQASAVFIEWTEYITLSVPLFIAAAFAIPQSKITPLPRTLLAFFIVGFAFTLLHLPFFERVFVFSDVALVAVAAYGITCSLSRLSFAQPGLKPYAIFGVLCVIVGFTLGNLESNIKKLGSLESPAKLSQMQHIGNIVGDKGILLTSTDEAPWFEGFTLAHVAAPGMLHDTHNFEAWTAFWNSTSTTEQIAFLNSFPSPLYIATLRDQKEAIGPLPTCVQQLNPALWVNRCQ